MAWRVQSVPDEAVCLYLVPLSHEGISVFSHLSGLIWFLIARCVCTDQYQSAEGVVVVK